MGKEQGKGEGGRKRKGREKGRGGEKRRRKKEVGQEERGGG